MFCGSGGSKSRLALFLCATWLHTCDAGKPFQSWSETANVYHVLWILWMIRLVQMSQHNPIAASSLFFQVGIASLSWSRTYPRLWPLSHMVSKHILVLSSSFHSDMRVLERWSEGLYWLGPRHPFQPNLTVVGFLYEEDPTQHAVTRHVLRPHFQKTTSDHFAVRECYQSMIGKLGAPA